MDAMLAMAVKLGGLTAEADISRIEIDATLGAMPEGWQKEKMREVATRLRRAVKEARTPFGTAADLGCEVLP